MMQIDSASKVHQSQRISVDPEPFRPGQVKIRIQQFDDRLGWYTASCLRMPVDEIPALQTALARVSSLYQSSEHETRKVIPFPALSDAEYQTTRSD